MTDNYIKVNPILRMIMSDIYYRRSPLPSDILASSRRETVNDMIFSEIWFMTPGCSHDMRGGCTMCNYGKGMVADDNKVLEAIRKEIVGLPHVLQELIVTPTGSMLDDCEVPPEMRSRILDMFRDVKCHDFLIETRATTVSIAKLEALGNAVKAERIFIEMGVECTNEWVLRNCINKNLIVNEVREAVRLIHNAKMYACANVGLGIPFLSESCNIALAKSSIRTLFDLGVDTIVLFPYHVKPGTLTAFLWEHDRYKCSSLWAIPEVLASFSDSELDRIQISWYRNYYTDKKKVLSSPSIGEDDYDLILTLLDMYKNHPCRQSLDCLQSFSNLSRKTWKDAINKQSPYIDVAAVREHYFYLSKAFGIPLDDMLREWENMEQSLEGVPQC